MLRINDILRAADVKRWHIVSVIREQNLAEHSYSVAMLAGEIASRLEWSTEDIRNVMIAAMFHDITEVISGDIPTPTKVRAEKAGFDLNSLFGEFKATGDWIIPAQMKTVLKCADHLEGMLFLRKHQLGDHAKQVYNAISKAGFAYFSEAEVIGKTAKHLWFDIVGAQYVI